MILARAELANDTFDELLLAARNTLLAAIRWSEGISELMMQLSDVPSSQRRI
ncbi:MAG: hypothetical protein P1U49_15800 [Minwuia sp.]|nr:hypothetical protein [Minwuia sp.]